MKTLMLGLTQNKIDEQYGNILNVCWCW